MPDSHSNFAYSTVATAPSPASSGTSLVVASGTGNLFPAVPFNATVWPSGDRPLSSNAEIVRVTDRSTDTLTITRQQEGTSARSIAAGDQIAATITAKTLTDAEAPFADTGSTLGTSYTTSQLTMRQVANQRLFDWPISQRCPGLIAWDPMSGTDLTRWGRTTRAGTPTTTVNADGSVTVSASAGGVATADFVSGYRPRILAFAAEVTFKAGFATADVDGLEVGLYKEDGSAGVWSYYNGTGCGIFAHGTGPTTSSASPAQPTAYTIDTSRDLTVGIYMTDPTAIAYIRQGDTTAFVTKSNFTLTGTASDNRLASTLRDWRLGFSVSAKASKSFTVTKFAAAYMPGDSFSNPRVITYKDGTPYTRDGKYFLTGTQHVSGNFTDHSTAIYSFDPVSYRAEIVSHLFAKVGSNLIHAGPGQVFYDDDTDEWGVLMSTWGPTASKSSGGIDVAYGTTSRDLVGGGVFFVNLTALSLGSTSYYDMAARWDASADLWRVGVIETGSRTAWSTNYPAYFEGASLTSLSKIRADTASGTQDGVQWAKVGGTWYLITGGSSSFLSYDAALTSATSLTSWTSSTPSNLWNSFGSYPPHAALLPVSDDANTRYLALCYGADVSGPTSVRGSLVVLEADEQPTGWEFSRRKNRYRMSS